MAVFKCGILADHQDKDEVGEFDESEYNWGGSVMSSGNNLTDYDMKTGYSTSSSSPSDQWVTIDWSHYSDDLTINGVLFHTNENDMTDGEIKFYIDDVECPDTSNVGLNAIGGVFNCGLTGRVFRAECTTTCTPNFAVQEIKLWRAKIVSLDGTSYNFSGNEDTSTYPFDATRVFGLGSYGGWSGATWEDGYTVSRGTNSDSNVGLNLQFSATASVAQVVAIVESSHATYYLALKDGTATSNNISWDEVIFSDNIYGYTIIDVSPAKTVTDLVTWRTSPYFHWSKLIVLAAVCDTSSEPMEAAWSSGEPGLTTMTYVGEIESLTAPSYTICAAAVTDISYAFYRFDDSLNATVGSALNWISSDSSTITIEPSQQAYLDYEKTTLTIVMWAKQTVDPYNENSDMKFEVYLESIIDPFCIISIIPSPAVIDPQEAELYAAEALVFEIEEAVDTGTENIQATSGLESYSCGPLIWTQKTLHTFVLQDSSNERQFSVQTEDPSHVGEHILTLVISSQDYPAYIPPITYEAIITILPCAVLSLEEAEDHVAISPLVLVFNLPYSQNIDLPLYEPSPNCGLSNADLSYEVINESLPDWVLFDADGRTVELDIDETVELSSPVKVEIEAKYNGLSKSISFAVTQIGEEAEEPEPEPVIEEPEPEPEPEPEVVEQAASTWDGWKTLLQQYKFLPEGITLPPPNPDPLYIPTPPIPTISKVDSRGKTQIKFSEDIFMYEDLKNLKIPKPPQQGRQLQSSVRITGVEEVNFIQVLVEPGDESDPDKLGFDYSVEFGGPQTIEVEVFWENPPYVSANQPEDYLIIKLNGPFYDKQDGIDVESNFKELRQRIPPQLVPGGLTDALSAGGGPLQAASAGAVAGNAAMNIFLAGSLSQVWGMINNLQMVLHAPLINLQFPANAQMIYAVMISVGTFDFLPTDDFYPYFFPKLPEDNAFNDKFDDMDIGSTFLVMNMGTMLLILTFYLVLYTIYPCAKFLRKELKCAKKLHKSLKPMLFWNHSIIFIQEGFLDILIASAINMQFFSNGSSAWSEASLVVTNLLCIFLTGCCSVLYFFTVGYLWPRFAQLKNKKMKSKYEPVYEMLDLRHGHWTMLWPVFFMTRRFIFVIGVCGLSINVAAQIYCFLAPTMAVLMLIALVKPLQGLQTNRLEVYNSFTLLSIAYCLMCFTKLALDAEARYNMGYLLIAITVKNIVVNILIIGSEPVRMCKLRCKKRWLNRHQIKKRWKLRAQKTKAFFKRAFTRKPEALQGKELGTNNLSVISENPYESLDSDVEIQKELDKHGLGNLPYESRTPKGVENALIDKLNADAVTKLEERAKAAQDKVKEVLDMYTFGVGQNPKLIKYKLPVIDDLVTPQVMSRMDKSVFEKQDELQQSTLAGLQNKVRLLSAQSNANKQQQSNYSDSASEMPSQRVNQILIDEPIDVSDQQTTVIGKTHSMRYFQEKDEEQDGDSTWISNAKIRSKTMFPAKKNGLSANDQMSSTRMPQAQEGGWINDNTPQLDFMFSRRVFEDDDEDNFINPEHSNQGTSDNIILGMTKTKNSVPKPLGQTTRMKDGQVVLFPTVYEDMTGIGEEVNPSQSILDRRTTIGGVESPKVSKLVSMNNSSLSKAKEDKTSKGQKRTAKSSFLSKPSVSQLSHVSNLVEQKQDLRMQVMHKLQARIEKKLANKAPQKVVEEEKSTFAPKNQKKTALVEVFDKGIRGSDVAASSSSGGSSSRSESEQEDKNKGKKEAAKGKINKVAGIMRALTKIKTEYGANKQQ